MKEYFKSLFKDNRPLRPKVDGLSLHQLGEGQVEWLERLFSIEEVKKAVWLLDRDKATGPDGFSLGSYKI